ncbi:MAG: hypothetical protein ACOY3D_02515 [Candidatus Omnitrophota bacterium]
MFKGRTGLAFILCVALVFSGCAMLESSRKKKEEQLEKIEKQKEKYLRLRKDLNDRKIRVGDAQEDVRDKYGEPDDTFSSASEVSNFSLWTYEFPLVDNRETDFRPVRMYFNNGKLSYWTN